MKCPNCGAEVRKEDKFCGECGNPLRPEIAPKWKWGSMIISLFLMFLFWLFSIDCYNEGIPIGWFIFALPAIAYLMYKERTEGKTYERLIWVLFPLILLFSVVEEIEAISIGFFIFAIPAIVIDVIYVYKTR